MLAQGVLPILGPRTPEQLADNLPGAQRVLSDAQLRRLDEASAIVLGFPHDVVRFSAETLGGDKLALTDRPPIAVC